MLFLSFRSSIPSNKNGAKNCLHEQCGCLHYRPVPVGAMKNKQIKLHWMICCGNMIFIKYIFLCFVGFLLHVKFYMEFSIFTFAAKD